MHTGFVSVLSADSALLSDLLVSMRIAGFVVFTGNVESAVYLIYYQPGI